jgi:hypothetical protein
MTPTTEPSPNVAVPPDVHMPDRPSYDDINTPVIVLIGVISAVVTLLTIWAVEGLYYHWHNGLVRELTYERANPLQADVIAAQRDLLVIGDEERQYKPLDSVVPEVIERYKIGQQTGESGASGEPSPQSDDEESDQ